MIYRIILFLVINFGGLAIGGLFTGRGVPSEWYQSLNKAPWTPPGWVFGSAWTVIMLCFSLYMALAWKALDGDARRLLIGLFIVQWLLNVAWNPVFFHYQHVLLGLVVISLLTILIGIFLFYFWRVMGLWSLLVLPYFAWLLIATSLNGYILVNN